MAKGSSKKHAKGRLDKYYHMAKEQGYRARSAFKLIQLNKKFNFLEKSKVVIDLCAAPGGWLQVAAKYMPKGGIIVGVDLAPIKPIPGVISFVEDITTEKCKATLRAQLQRFKADVVLHDGAPNVGASWLQDAFTQNELVLSSLRLAVHFLNPGGTFVTKVFRSKDYNKLLWVFNQLFSKVEATKPASSRNVSAEIFVVCTGYLAPKKIDPKFLDPKCVFKELDDGAVDANEDDKTKKERQSAIMNDLLHPEKRKRHRDGYQDGDYTLSTTNSVMDFINGSDHIGTLAKSNSLSFDVDQQAKDLKNHPLTTKEILACCSDLKVLGKKDFKTLLKWRDSIRLDLKLEKSKAEKKKELDDELAAKAAIEETEESLTEKLNKASQLAAAQLKKDKKKSKERKSKTLLKMRLGMQTPMDIGLEASNIGIESYNEEIDEPGGLFSLSKEEIKKSNAEQLDESDYSDTESEQDSDSEEEIYDSDQEAAQKAARLEKELESLYDHYQNRILEKDPLAHKREQKKKNKANGLKAEFDNWYGVEYDSTLKNNGSVLTSNKIDINGDEVVGNNEDEEDLLLTDSESESEEPLEPKNLSKRARTFFDNPVFKSLEAADSEDKPVKKSKKTISAPPKGLFDMEIDDMSDDEDIIKMNADKQDQMDVDQVESDDEEKKFEVVPSLQKDYSVEDDNLALRTAIDYSLAQRMIHPSGKRDMIDDAYNRYAFNDTDGLPDWFQKDEEKHSKINIPITKAAVELMKTRAKDLDARPIKKIAEAKFRKQFRAQRRAEKFQKQANEMAENEDVPESSKAKNIVKLMAKAKTKKEGKKPCLVVAKGTTKGIQGRPKGVKGRYKMLDPRMKKELRADKRIKKAAKKKRH